MTRMLTAFVDITELRKLIKYVFYLHYIVNSFNNQHKYLPTTNIIGQQAIQITTTFL